MQVPSLSSSIVLIDRVMDYVPIISTFTNLIDIFHKYKFTKKENGPQTLQQNHYYKHITEKSYVRCVILLVPFLGNLSIALYDGWHALRNRPVPPINPIQAPEPTLAPAPVPETSTPVVPLPENPAPAPAPEPTTPAIPVLQTASDYRPQNNESKTTFNARIFQETLQACERGYVTPNQVYVKLNHQPMLSQTVTYDQLPSLPPLVKLYKTNFAVFPEDTFQVLLRRKQEGANPVGINMANRYYIGGGVLHGSFAQEEALCRRSNHYLGLQTQPYPLPETGGIYCPHVQVFRNSDPDGYAFMDKPVEVALVAMAAYQLGYDGEDCRSLGLPFDQVPDEATLKQHLPFVEKTKEKIRNMLKIMAMKGHTYLVLGALGCGAFLNPPILIAELFREVFNEDEFIGRFQQVDFAILKLNQKDEQNVEAFSNVCNKLNGDTEKHLRLSNKIQSLEELENLSHIANTPIDDTEKYLRLNNLLDLKVNFPPDMHIAE